jgi:hypothetical protein
MFETDKWLERQNTIIEKQFAAMGRKLEELYRNEAANQVESVGQNILVDMNEVHTLKAENKTLTEWKSYWSNLALKTFSYLSIPSLRDELCAVATTLIGGDYVVPSGGEAEEMNQTCVGMVADLTNLILHSKEDASHMLSDTLWLNTV